ncbi:leucyl aminopeptidase family protein [Microvirga antarctica]|uniref:leucyl aminopeptidase family protein n=1 Tax=Microvirga antarctica TaxID=2819233 RepID=UPI001B30F5BE|nr:leucyl aminopeptidase family protein [Microvirga antarctica]
MTFNLVDPADAPKAIPLRLVGKAQLEAVLASLPARERAILQASGFDAAAGSVRLMHGEDGAVSAVVAGIGASILSQAEHDLWAIASLPTALPQGVYRLADEPSADTATLLALGWALGTYAFETFKKQARRNASLVWPEHADRGRVVREAEALTLARDLINTPANLLGPVALAEKAKAMAEQHGANVTVTVGNALLEQNYPLVYHVGRAAVEEPRLVDIRWGEESHPRVTLVGKGVIFDTGGLDLKPPASMKIMKKDMGGAAAITALAHMVMAAKLPVRLRVLLPIVENAISHEAFRPLDVLPSRNGMTIEIGNTDAEGRLILADALTEADSEKPALLINMATLTGNARVAFGPELPTLFTRHDDLAAEIARHSVERADPLWRMPLWPHYRKQLDSKVAHMNNVSDSAFAGAIIAGLFLAEFVSDETRWAHLDMSGWNFGSRPGRPEGGDAQAIRALYGVIEDMAAKG